MTIVVDPYLISIPHGNVDAETVIAYAKRLGLWDKEFVTHPEKYVVSGWAMNEIYHQNLAPTIDNLKILFSRFGVDNFFSPHDIAPACDGVIANAPQMEERAGIDDDVLGTVEHIEGTEVVLPEEFQKRIHPEVALWFVRALIYAGYSLGIQNIEGLWSIATAQDRVEHLGDKILVEASVETVAAPPSRMSREWPLLLDPDYRYVTMSIADVYEDDPHLATKIAWCKLKIGGTRLTGVNPSEFTFGDKFISSINRSSMQKRPNLADDLEAIFKAIVFVLEDIWSYGSDKHHALRESIQNRKSPQQTRKTFDHEGNAQFEKAGRVEVTANNPCLRLHYWQCIDGQYEFANVTDDHDDPTIY